jgi:hypothetical protein
MAVLIARSSHKLLRTRVDAAIVAQKPLVGARQAGLASAKIVFFSAQGTKATRRVKARPKLPYRHYRGLRSCRPNRS